MRAIKCQNGLSMLEMSVSMGLLGGVMLISMNVVNQQKSNETYIKSKGEIQKAISLLAVNLKDPENCRSVVAGRKYQKTSSSETRLSNLRIKLKKKNSLITNCTTTPQLPAGLSINKYNCVISGQPLTAQSAQNYTLNVYYGNNTTPVSSTFSLLINTLTQITNVASSLTTTPTLSFHGSSGTIGRVGNRMTISPTRLGSTSSNPITRCSVSPALPPGLEMDLKTCIITGIPIGETPPTTYTISATNSYGTIKDTITLGVNSSSSGTSADSTRSAFYKGEVGKNLNISPNLPDAPTTATNSSTEETMEILKPDTKYKEFKTESIDVLQQNTAANNVVDLQVKFRIKSRDAKRWTPFDSTSDDDIIITEKIPLIITRDSSNTITDCTAAVSESNSTAKEKFCKSLGAATTWDSTTKKCSFSGNAQCPQGQVLKKMEGMSVVCEDVKNQINLSELFDESQCPSTGAYRIIESNGKLKIDCNNSVVITQRSPERGGAIEGTQNITIAVDSDLDSSTVTSNNVQVLLQSTENGLTTYTAVNSAVTYSNKTITINPEQDLVAGKTYKIQIGGNIKTANNKTINGIESGNFESWTFVAQ